MCEIASATVSCSHAGEKCTAPHRWSTRVKWPTPVTKIAKLALWRQKPWCLKEAFPLPEVEDERQEHTNKANKWNPTAQGPKKEKPRTMLAIVADMRRLKQSRLANNSSAELGDRLNSQDLRSFTSNPVRQPASQPVPPPPTPPPPRPSSSSIPRGEPRNVKTSRKFIENEQKITCSQNVIVGAFAECTSFDTP